MIASMRIGEFTFMMRPAFLDLGKVSWNCSDTFEDKLTEFCYLRYFGVKDFAVSYNSTVS